MLLEPSAIGDSTVSRDPYRDQMLNKRASVISSCLGLFRAGWGHVLVPGTRFEYESELVDYLVQCDDRQIGVITALARQIRRDMDQAGQGDMSDEGLKKRLAYYGTTERYAQTSPLGKSYGDAAAVTLPIGAQYIQVDPGPRLTFLALTHFLARNWMEVYVGLSLSLRGYKLARALYRRGVLTGRKTTIVRARRRRARRTRRRL